MKKLNVRVLLLIVVLALIIIAQLRQEVHSRIAPNWPEIDDRTAQWSLYYGEHFASLSRITELERQLDQRLGALEQRICVLEEAVELAEEAAPAKTDE